MNEQKIFNLLYIIFLLVIFYLIFFKDYKIIDNFNLTQNYNNLNDYDGLNGLVNTYSDNKPDISLINNFIKQYPGAKLFFVRDSASYMLTKNTWVFAYDPYQPSNPYGEYLANLNGSQIFGNQMIYTIKPINLIVEKTQTYDKSFFLINVLTQNGQKLDINFIVNLIQMQPNNPYFTLDGTPVQSIILQKDQLKLINLQENFTCFSDVNGSSMATGSTGLDNPADYTGLPILPNFLKKFPGAQAYYIYKTTSESILPSNSIVFMYDPSNPNNTNGNRLATSTGTTFFNGEYALELYKSKNNNIYGVDQLDSPIQTYLKDGYTLFDAIPFYETSPIDIFRFSVFARKIPNKVVI